MEEGRPAAKKYLIAKNRTRLRNCPKHCGEHGFLCSSSRKGDLDYRMLGFSILLEAESGSTDTIYIIINLRILTNGKLIQRVL
jgi:hypothetical protein